MKKTRSLSVARGEGASSRNFTLGASGIAKLNAVEGVKQSAASRAMFKQFDRDGLSDTARRSAIAVRHKPKG